MSTEHITDEIDAAVKAAGELVEKNDNELQRLTEEQQQADEQHVGDLTALQATARAVDQRHEDETAERSAHLAQLRRIAGLDPVPAPADVDDSDDDSDGEDDGDTPDSDDPTDSVNGDNSDEGDTSDDEPIPSQPPVVVQTPGRRRIVADSWLGVILAVLAGLAVLAILWPWVTTEFVFDEFQSWLFAAVRAIVSLVLVAAATYGAGMLGDYIWTQLQQRR